MYRPRPSIRRRRLVPPLLLLAFLLASPAAAVPRPAGPEIPVGVGQQSALAVFPDGGFVVAWTERTAHGRFPLYARVLGPADEARSPYAEVGELEQVDGARLHSRPAVAVTDGGGFVVAWTGPRPGGAPGVFLRRFAADATALGGALLVSGDDPRPAHEPSVAVAPNGHLAVSWTVENPVDDGAGDGLDYSDVRALLLTADGVPQGPPFQLNGEDPEEQGASQLAFTTGGTLVAVWQSWRFESFYDVVRRRFGAGGTPLEDDQVLDSQRDEPDLWDFQPRLAATAGGGHLVVWVRSEADSGPGEVRALAFGADGAPAGDLQVLGGGEGSRVAAPSVAALPEGGAVVGWLEGCGLDACPPVFPGQELLVRPVDAAAAPTAAAEAMAMWVSGSEPGTGMVASGPDGTVVATWDRGGPNGAYVAARRFSEPCVQDAATLCLLAGRFRVTVDWQGPRGGAGSGVAVRQDDHWGTFWFFRESNPEVAIKVLDGTPINDSFWVFRASLSNVAYTAVVEDTASGRRLLLRNPPGTLASSGDTTTLPSIDLDAPAATAEATAPPVPAPRTAAPLTPVIPCTPTDTVACFHDGALAVQVEWVDGLGNRHFARHAPLTDDAVYFWFFRPGNPEVFLKILDGGPINGNSWVFWAGLSDVAFTVTVSDTNSGFSQRYTKPRGQFGSGADTQHFPAP